MDINERLESLLIAQIAASNRTTRAVRAFVRFLFIQLIAITLALGINAMGIVFQDPSECSFGICPPNTGAQILAGLVWLIGVIWSSSAGFSELSMSDVPRLPTASKAGQTETKPRKPSETSSKTNHAAIEDSNAESGDGSRTCSNCGAEIGKFDVACTNCDSWQM